LLSLAWQHAYEVAILVSGDADYIPAVEYVAEPGPEGHQRSMAEQGPSASGGIAGAAFPLDKLIPDLTR